MKREMTDAELAEIQKYLKTAYCNPFWRKHVIALTEEVQRLKNKLDNQERFENTSLLEDRLELHQDTVIL